MLLSILTLLGALGLFLYGMNLLSAGLQKAAGPRLRGILSSVTSNPAKGILTGLGVTATIQSSSATTVMVVGFVNAGLLTLSQAISVIMGANIGTTLTAWIIAVFGFKADISILAVPLMAVAFILSSAKREKLRNTGELIAGFCLLFLGLSFMKNSVPDLQSSPEVLSFVSAWSGHGFLSVLLFCLVGAVLTLVLQSSSATVALTLIFLNMGWIGFDMAAAMVLGENIGTTITANIAAAVGNPNARRAALAHTIFNLVGLTWALAFFPWVVRLDLGIISLLGLSGSPDAPLYGISMFHTIFNVLNTLIMVWFIPQIEKAVCAIIKDRSGSEDSGKLVYINAGLISTPELAISEAEKEVQHFARIMRKGLAYVKEAIGSVNDTKSFPAVKEKLVKYEEISDRIEYEVISFLEKLDRANLSDRSERMVKALIRISGEMESLGDSGEAIGRLISRAQERSLKISDDKTVRLFEMSELLDRAYAAMISNLENSDNIRDVQNSIDAEIEINRKRDLLRNAELDSGDSYFEGVLYLALLEELEKMGDFVINISQALVGKAQTRDLA